MTYENYRDALAEVTPDTFLSHLERKNNTERKANKNALNSVLPSDFQNISCHVSLFSKYWNSFIFSFLNFFS
jgi:hypothetical protein